MSTGAETTDAIGIAEATCRRNILLYADRKLASEGKWAELLRVLRRRHRVQLFVSVPVGVIHLLKLLLYWGSAPSQVWLDAPIVLVSVIMSFFSLRASGRCSSALRGLGEMA